MWNFLRRDLLIHEIFFFLYSKVNLKEATIQKFFVPDFVKHKPFFRRRYLTACPDTLASMRFFDQTHSHS